MSILDKIKKEQDKILKKIRRDIIKSAKKDECFLYWDIVGINPLIVKDIVFQLESEGKMIKSKGLNYKLIRW